MNVPPPNVQYYVLDTSKPPPLPSSSVSGLNVVGTSSPAVSIVPPPQSANYGHQITLPVTTSYAGGYASAANVYNYTADYSLPMPAVVLQQQQPDFTQFFSIPPPPLPNMSLSTPQTQLQQHSFSNDNASISMKRNGLANRNYYKDVQTRINRYRRLGERSKMPLDALTRPRRSRRRKNAAYHQEIFEQFQRNFENFKHDENSE
uniref:Uncharacterized protein n=1 Tax=Romanomermis culicivorax TaxID=13658 RepID=A0A915I596_ROMCU